MILMCISVKLWYVDQNVYQPKKNSLARLKIEEVSCSLDFE